jgi:Uma2 family endonuclease
MATTKLITAEDLFEMGSDCDRELIRGELTPVSPASHRSSAVAARLIFKLGSFVYVDNLGQLSGADGGFVLSRDPDVVVAPDVAFVSAERLPPPDEQNRFLETAPDFVAEVVSPSDRFTDLNDKVMLYLNAGVRLVWVVDPMRETVTVYTSEHSPNVVTTAGTLDCGDVIPGVSLPVAEIFR